ncbi:MAG: alpha-hydroxy-acid oxidizing protein [Chloroflexi bacterium]|nr:alpha-hydroxy-acid oxidizing protein [Chloroflexota bacterium]
MALDYVSNQEIVLAARKRLNQAAWDYLSGGSESETTMRRNRLAFDRLAFRPRVLVDVSHVDTATAILGHRLRIPVMFAPIGSLQLFHPEGGAASARAAGEYGIVHVVSSVTEPSLEEIAAAGAGPKVFQLYIRGDWEWIKGMLGRVKQAGYTALCITVDTAHYSNRERPMLGRWNPPTRRAQIDPSYGASVTWELLDRIKETIGLPLYVKGVATAEDAALAVQHGVEVVWVSNHGGRQLDHGLGTLDMLPEIAQAVGGRAQIVLDGGVQRGTDVVKAVALGATAVAIGKLQGWGLGAGGSEGLVRMLELLEAEIEIAMALLGVTCIEQLGPAYVCKAEPVTRPHEMSGWIHLPGERIL